MITPTDFIPKVVLAMRCTPIVYMYYFFQTKDKINLQKNSLFLQCISQYMYMYNAILRPLEYFHVVLKLDCLVQYSSVKILTL